MMDMLVALYPTLKALWVVCFVLVFLAMLAWVMRPSRRRDFDEAALIPLRDDLPDASRRGVSRASRHDVSRASSRDPT